MFDRFVRMAQARAALRAGDSERALRLLGDPVLDRGHRKVRALLDETIEAILERAGRNVEAGRHAAAERSLLAVLAAEPDRAAAQAALSACRADRAERQRRDTDVAGVLTRVDLAFSQGDLESAAGCAEQLDGEDRDRVLQRVEVLGQRARDAVAAVVSAIPSLGVEGALGRLRGARGLDRCVPLGEGVRAALVAQLGRELMACPESDRAARLGAISRRAEDLFPGLGLDPALAAFREARAGERVDALWNALELQELERAAELADDAACSATAPQALVSAARAAHRGAFESAAAALDSVQDPRAAAVQAAFRSHAARVSERVESARRAAEEGRLTAAREALLELLEEFPGHEGVRSEMQILDHGADARAQGMMEARAMVRAGRLAGAAALAVRYATPGPEGEEARALLREVQPQIDLVRRGVDQVRARLHGPDAASAGGLTGCQRRLEQLGDVQSDSEDVAKLRDAVSAEIDGHAHLDAVMRAADEEDAAAALEALHGWCDLRDRLWEPSRLDARAERAVEAVLGRVDGALANGRCARAEAWLEVLDHRLPLPGGLAERVRGLRADVTGRRVRAAHEAQVADYLATVERDLDAAEQALSRAQELAGDEPAVRRVAAALQQAARALRQVESIEALEPGSRPDEVSEARRALRDMGSTPPAMRTRVFDLKRDLARAQGLEGAFLLRVDEAGEFLVLRQESVTLGNVRDRGCDLPLQARLASRHARLRRTMSFHGGQVDEVVAERGEVFVDGEAKPSIRLVDGTRFRLGEHVEFRYRLPSSRSLTARLESVDGVELGGARAMLWMKDRGRDGRILIGSDPDAHVRVAGATGTVEIYAGSDGRIRVRTQGSGTIDRVAFDTEHPIAGGAFVAARGIGFTVQPWTPSDATLDPA